MAAYVQETGRSFPNPTSNGNFTQEFKRPSNGNYRSHGDYPGVGTGTSYEITFEGHGPGSMPLGKDIVHYLGDDDPTVIGGTRQGIYRYYRGSKDDHKYTRSPEITKADMGCENESWKKAASGYNKEPRNGAPVFWLMREQVENSVPVYQYYSYWPDDTQVCVGTNVPTGLNGVGCGRNKYKNVGLLGYAFTTAAHAQAYCTGSETPKPLYEYLHPDPDHFYTIDPASEVNLADNSPIPPLKSYNKEYNYLGILCYVFETDVQDQPNKTVVDIGKIGPTGQCVDKSGWYAYTSGNQKPWGSTTGLWSQFMYQQMRDDQGNNVEGPPAINGWGYPGNVDATSNDAFFEWSYGLQGAVKAAVPRFLGFEDSYDSQFLFYLYDTSYPWNGPIFSTQYILSNAQCCPNTTDPEGCPQCAPVWSYHSHFYEIHSDTWETTKSRITISDESSTGVQESFFTVGTDDRRLFFRYTTRDGDWNSGDKINGWDIVNVFYFGDELKCGVMEFSQAQNAGQTFSYEQQFTSSDGGTIKCLAGYGIPNKCAFTGVYEFPKKLSYWKVQINPKALIPWRTLDEAKLEAVVDDDGSISSVLVINGGRGYIEPSIVVIHPREMEDFSANDPAKFMGDSVSMDEDWKKTFQTPESSQTVGDSMRDTQKTFGVHTGAVNVAQDKNKQAFKMRKAKLEISEMTELGIIKSVRVVDGGAGYSQADTPTVQVVEPEHIKWDMQKEDGAPDPQAFGNTRKEMFDGFGGGQEGGAQGLDEESENTKYIKSSFDLIASGKAVDVPDSYIRAAELTEDTTNHCLPLNPGCIEIGPGIGLVSKALPKSEQFAIVSGFEPGVAQFEKDVMPFAVTAAQQTDSYVENNSHLYGPFGKSNCIKTGQPKLYNITRWFDMPCAYLDVGDDGEQKAFGWLPYRYCASKLQLASYRVSLEVEGRITGSQGADCMDFIKGLPKPLLQLRRDPEGNAGKRTWNCRRGSIKGRCYRDPNNSSDIVFVPVGLDENTWDYNRSNFTELEQLQMWGGSNMSSSAAVQTWLGHPTEGDPAGTPHSVDYTALTVAACSGGAPPNECWDSYVRGVNASDGPLKVYCGYDNQGNGIAGNTYCDTPELFDACAALDKVMDSSIAVNPNRISGSGANALMMMGPYNGTMTVRNNLTGSITALERAIRNYGNPYFDECSTGKAWTKGRIINEELR